MSEEEWKKLPKVKGITPKKLDVAIKLRVYTGDMQNTAKSFADKWINRKSEYVNETKFQEDLTAFLLTAAITFVTRKYHLYALPETDDPYNPVDRYVVTDIEGKPLGYGLDGSSFQIVSTAGIGKVNKKINKKILERIELKHKKGTAYSSDLQLAVLVVQDDWLLEANELMNIIQEIKEFSSYWAILPFKDKFNGVFAVNYLNFIGDDRGQGQIVIDIRDGVKARFLNLFLKDGKTHDINEIIKYDEQNNK